MRAFATLTLALAALGAPAAHAAAELKNPHGSTEGLVRENPEWSAGAQLGNYGSTGVVFQKVGFYDGALNLGLGLAFGGISAHADYVILMSEHFERVHSPANPGYNALRGQLRPYVGGGVQVGNGLAFRIPFGLQYTMTKDPFDFYGGLVPVIGRFLTKSDFGAQLWFEIGARVLL